MTSANNQKIFGMDSKATAAHDSNLKRGLNDSLTSERGDSFDLKKVKREVDESDSNVLLRQLKQDRIPELTPVHNYRYDIKLELKSEDGYSSSSSDSSPTNSECPSPFDMGKSFERLIEKGRAEFIKRERRESERAIPIKLTSPIGSTSKDLYDVKKSLSSWWMKEKRDSEEKHYKGRNEYKSPPFCFKCKRYGHFKSRCRNPFYYRYPQRYLNEHPELRQKLRENAIRKRIARQNENREVLPWKAQPQSTNRFPNSKFHPNGHTSHVFYNNPQTNSLQLNQIAEVVNQILRNQQQIMSQQGAQIQYEHFNFRHNENQKSWLALSRNDRKDN